MGQSPEDLPVKSWPGHKWLIILLIVFALVSLAYSLVLPLGEAADEFEHFALIRFIAERRRPPLTLQEQLAIGVKGDASPLYHSLVALLTQHVQVADLPELLDPRHQLKRAIPDDRLPFKGLYHTQDEAFPFRGIVLAWHLARLVSIPLGVVTILAVYLTVSTIYPHRLFLALAAAAFVAFIPRFTINSAIVSDDNLVLPLIALATLCLVRMVRGDRRPRTLILVGAWLGFAAIAKYHALLLLPLMTLVTAVLAWQDNWGSRTWLRHWGLVVLTFLLIAGVWFSFLFFQFNQVADRGWFQGLLAPLGDPVIATSVDRLLESDPGSDLAYEPALNWSEWLTLLFRTFWFRFGRGHLIQSSIINQGLGLLTLLALLGLAFAGLQFWRRNQGHLGNLRAWRLDIILLVLLVVLYLALVLVRYLVLPTRETAQGRHLYPALTALALFFVLGLSRLPQLFGAWRNPLATDERERRLDQLLFLGIGGLFFTFVVLAAPLFIVPVYYPFLPVTRLDPAKVPIQHYLGADLGGGLNLRGYSLSSPQVTAGQALPVTLFWQAGTAFERDYLTRLCLFDRADRQAVCRQGHPDDGRYPTRAWEPDTLIRDEIQLPTPACLPPGDYELKLSASPLRLDAARTTIDNRVEAGEAISLAQVTVSAGPPDQTTAFDLWVGRERHAGGIVDLSQIRQALTVIDYRTPEREADPPEQVQFRPGPADPSRPTGWFAIAPPLAYPCSVDSVATVHNFIVDPSVRPGTYQLDLGDQVAPELLVGVSTRPRNYSMPAGLTTVVNASIGDEVELLGYNLDLKPRRPGERIEVELYWRSLNTMQHRYVGSLHLLDPSITMWGQIDHVLGDDFEYPNNLWAPGEVIRQVFQLPINSQTPAGLYAVEFGVYDRTFGDFDFLPITLAAAGTPLKQLSLGQIRVLDHQHAKSPEHSAAINLGDQIRLIGFDLDSPALTIGRPFDFALHWQTIDRPDSDYTVFTQLIGPDGLVWSQQDNQPQGGRYPTTAWAVPDQVIDRYRLTLDDGAPPGQYRLVVGMYDLATGQRLPAVDRTGSPLPNNAIELTRLNVAEK